ncbi:MULTISPECIES: hypothetical protein [unclassified Kitasatospora]|uniref:hypothetical protein n=1 Tax=unclassified Kitasatospora TaxID=2633591 RepID=UPI0033DAA49F
MARLASAAAVGVAPMLETVAVRTASAPGIQLKVLDWRTICRCCCVLSQMTSASAVRLEPKAIEEKSCGSFCSTETVSERASVATEQR